MKLLVLSDSHRDRASLFEAIEREQTADLVYFLGDGANEIQEAISVFGNKLPFVTLRGNCDFSSDAPALDVRTAFNMRIYATHGYVEQVKYGLSVLASAARGYKCSIALFGHTHEPCCLYEDGLWLFNPGSLKNGDYGTVTISEKGVLCNNLKLL